MAITLTRANVRPLLGAVVRAYELGTAAEVGDQVYIDANDKAHPGRANAGATVRARGFIVASEGVLPGTSAAAGKTVSVCVLGPLAGFTGMDLAQAVWVSAATAGAVTQTKPTSGGQWSMAMGYPLRTDVLMVMPQSTDPVSN